MFCCLVSLIIYLWVVLYFNKPVGQVKIQIMSKNTQQYNTPKCLLSYLLFNMPNCYFSAGEFRRYLRSVTGVCEEEWNCPVVVLLFLFLLINYEISLLPKYFSSLNLSNKLGSTFANHSDSLLSEKWFKLFATSIPFIACVMQENLTNRFSWIQIL